MDGELHAWKAVLTALASSQSLTPGRLAEFYAEAKAVAAQQDGWINLIDPAGRQLLNTLRPYGEPLPDTAATELLRSVITGGQPVVGDLVFGNVSQRWVIPVAVPVIRGSKVLYMLELIFAPDRLTQLLQRHHLSVDWTTAILDRQHRIVTRLPLTAERMGKPAQPWFAAALRSADHGFVSGTMADGVPGRVVFNRLTEAPWFVTLAIPLAAVPSASPVYWWFIALGVLLGGSAVAFAVYASRKVTRPVALLAAQAEGILRGEASEGTPRSGLRELQLLEQAMVQAARSVQALQREEARATAAEARAKAEAEAAEALQIEIAQREQAEEALTASRATLIAALESMTDAVFITDSEGRFIEFNAAFAAFYHFPDKAACLTRFAEYPHIVEAFYPNGDVMPVDHWPVPRALRGETGTNCEISIHRKDIDKTWVASHSFAPIRNPEGVCVGAVVTGCDITEQKHAETALRESEERFRVAQELSPDGFSILRPVPDAAGRVTDFTWVYVNATVARMTGTDPHEVMGRSLMELFPGHRGSPLFDCYRQVAETGISRVLEAPYQGDSRIQAQTWFRVAVVSMGTDIAVLSQDVTARKQAEARLAADLAALTRMHELSGRRLDPAGLPSLLQDIMEAAVAVMGAERGTLQLVDGESLRIVAHHGHQPSFLEFFAAAENRASVCGAAMEQGARVIVPDAEGSELFAGTPSLTVLRQAGVRAIQSTPMLSRAGALLGILTTQWSAPHHPDEHDLWRLDLLVRQAADLIESAQAADALEALARFPDENPYPVLRVAPDGTVKYANRGSAPLLATWDCAIDRRLPAAWQERLARIYAHGAPEECEVVCAEGRVFSCIVTPVPAAGYLNLYARDITERKAAEEALRAAQAALEQRVKERTAALAEAVAKLQHQSQQLRTLGSELTLVEQRERLRLAEQIHDGLQQLMVAARYRVTQVGRGEANTVRQDCQEIGRLLDEAIADARSLTAELSPPVLRTGGLLAGLEWLARWSQEKHHLTVKVTAPTVPLPPLPEDLTVLLFQSVRELLFNTVKYAQVQEATVTLAWDASGLTLTVVDAGVGFDPHGLRGEGGGGGGFGLARIRHRLELLGGCMTLDSAPDQGTRVTLAVLLRTADQPTTAPAHPQPVASQEPALAPGPESPRPIRILVVDDHRVVRHALAQLLRAEADIVVVGEAGTGTAAVPLARQLVPDVVLMDINMPEMDGIDATRAIHAAFPAMRVIGLSMFDHEDQQAAMQNAGAVAYVSKSGPAEALLGPFAPRPGAHPNTEAVPVLPPSLVFRSLGEPRA